jgi:hypothetical protein
VCPTSQLTHRYSPLWKAFRGARKIAHRHAQLKVQVYNPTLTAKRIKRGKREKERKRFKREKMKRVKRYKVIIVIIIKVINNECVASIGLGCVNVEVSEQEDE